MKLVEITEFLVGNAAFITSLFNEDLMTNSLPANEHNGIISQT